MNHRILISKFGLDGHDRGALTVSRFLQQNGFEVIYSGLFTPPQEIAQIAFQEDVSAIGISSLTGAHLQGSRDLLNKLKEFDDFQPPVFIGGIIPTHDHSALSEIGIAGIFPTGSSLAQIVEWLYENLKIDKQKGRRI